MLPLEGLLRFRARADGLQTCHQRHQRLVICWPYASTFDMHPSAVRVHMFTLHREQTVTLPNGFFGFLYLIFGRRQMSWFHREVDIVERGEQRAAYSRHTSNSSMIPIYGPPGTPPRSLSLRRPTSLPKQEHLQTRWLLRIFHFCHFGKSTKKQAPTSTRRSTKCSAIRCRDEKGSKRWTKTLQIFIKRISTRFKSSMRKLPRTTTRRRTRRSRNSFLRTRL